MNPAGAPLAGAAAIARKVRSGETTAREIAEAALARIAAGPRPFDVAAGRAELAAMLPAQTTA